MGMPVLLTEWPEFRMLSWGRLVEHRIVVDTRNLLDAGALPRIGFEVSGVGAPVLPRFTDPFQVRPGTRN
jgi:hypothetical protein